MGVKHPGATGIGHGLNQLMARLKPKKKCVPALPQRIPLRLCAFTTTMGIDPGALEVDGHLETSLSVSLAVATVSASQQQDGPGQGATS